MTYAAAEIGITQMLARKGSWAFWVELSISIPGSSRRSGGATAIISDIWFAPDGRLFGGSPDGSLYEINTGNGNKTFLFNTGIDRLSGLTGIPEPATVGLLCVGALAVLRRRRR